MISPASPPVRRRPLLIAILLSLNVLLAAAWLRGGVGATPWDTADSQGRKMGFNDVFSGEHYGIILKNADLGHAAEQLEAFDWALAATQLVFLGLIFVLPRRPLKILLWLQPVIFFWGWIGLYAMPLAFLDVLVMHTMDREGFIDIPYISILGQGAWLWACFVMLWELRTPRGARQGAVSEGSLAVAQSR